MRRIRVIPVLLLKKGGLYKSVRFRNYKYIGDPINAVKIFNDKEVDELVLLDIDATCQGAAPNFKQIGDLAGEAFMPMAYGGGISSIEQIKKILNIGFEKVVLNYAAVDNPDLISEAAMRFGSSSIVVSVDVKKNWLGANRVYILNGSKNTGFDAVQHVKKMEEVGAGEIFLNSIDRDGTFAGFDIKLIETVSKAVTVPVIACGGANSMEDFRLAIDHGASAVAAGSYFVFRRPHNAVLITYPSQEELKKELYSQI